MKKFIQILDNTEEKINHMFTKGKNADERTFDFFLRSLTFFIILLFVLCYGGLVHAFSSADATFTDMIDVTLFLNSSMAETYYSDNYESPYVNPSDMSHMFVNTLNPSPFSVDYIDLYAEALNNNQAVNTTEYAFKYLVIFGPKNGYTDPHDGMNYFNIIEICADSVPSLIDKNTGYSDRGISDYCIYCPDGMVVNNYSFGFSYNSFDGYRTQRFGLSTYNTIDSDGCISLGSVGYGNTGYICYCNIPFYSFVYSNIYSSVDSSSRVYSTLSTFLEAVDQKQVYNLNPLLDSFIPPEPEPDPSTIESNANHNYLDNIEVGLSAQSNGQDLMSSEVVIGCYTEDDWILNHLDDYYLYVSYAIHFKDTMPSNPNDPTTTISYNIPLKTFLNNIYKMGVSEIFRNSIIENYGTMQEYYNNVMGSKYVTRAEHYVKGEYPALIEKVLYGTGLYYVQTRTTEQDDYKLFDFTLTVSCTLGYKDMNADDASGMFVKEFDFVNGNESVKVADILTNKNPWTGETTGTTTNPYVPSVGSDNNGGYSSSNAEIKNNSIIINNGNGYQDTELHQLTKADIDENHRNIIYTIESLRYSMERFGSTKEENDSFLRFILSEFGDIPGVAIMVASLFVICCVLILCFFIRIVF